MTQRNLKITLEYDGTRFYGWQVQPGRRTVQSEVERALRVLLRHPARVRVAGRTDAGVHALAQVCTVRTEVDLGTDRILRGLNGILPRDVAVHAVEDVHPAFDPRYSAVGKRYRYRILNRRGRPALRRHRVWHLWEPLDLHDMRRALAQLTGTHDFSAFRAADCPNKQPVKTLEVATLDEGGDAYLGITLVADGFLKQMVRIIVGTIVEVGTGKRAAESIAGLLQSGDRRLAGRTAPAQGLSLIEVMYGEREVGEG